MVSDVSAEYVQTDIGLFPEEWKITQVSKVSKVVDSLHKTPSFSLDGYSMVRVADIKTGNLNLDTTLKVSKKTFDEFTRNYKPKKTDIVLSRVGSYGVNSYVNTDEEFCIGQNTVVIQPKINSKYLYFMLNSAAIWLQIEDGSYGTGYKSLSLKNINELYLPLPEEKEQVAIANALSDVDALISSLEKLIAKKQAIKTATMQQLLTGKKRLPGFGEGKGYKQTELGEIPEDWDVCELGEAVSFLDGIRKPVKSSDRAKAQGIYPYYGASGIVDYVNDYLFDGEYILLGEDGENILSRNLPLAFKVAGKIWVNNHAHVMQPQNDFDIDYLTALLESFDYSLLNSGTAQPKLNKQSCLKIQVIKPNRKEQTAIATIFSSMDKEIEKIKNRLSKTKQIKQGMMQELLTGKTRLVKTKARDKHDR